jgi:membrane dipeptidase
MAGPFADLHCDLLSYLQADTRRTPYDSVARCSIPQLMTGNVRMQVMAIFTLTDSGSALHGWQQAQIFKQIKKKYAGILETYSDEKDHKHLKNTITIFIAVENASSLLEEHEPFDTINQRLSALEKEVGKPVYISMTWNMENRFGGGAHTNIGLKEDGKRLLHLLHQKKIAVDLSHASDKLAFDILLYIDFHHLNIPILASHSNFRSVKNAPRNLPDELVTEIVKREGIIGFNFYKEFVGEPHERHFVKHMEHMIELNGFNHYCFGADFFYGQDMPAKYKHDENDLFFPNFDNATCYSRLIDLWQKQLSLSEENISKISFNNLERYLKKYIL